MQSVVEAIEDKKLFGSLFKSQSTWTNWKIFLRGLFGLPMSNDELSVFAEYTGRQKAPAAPFKEAFAIVGRRGGKSFIASLIACYLALFHDWRPYLAPGEFGWIMVIAADRNQARVILGYIRAILKLKMFKDQVEKELTEEIRLKNQVIISIKTCDYRTLRGFTVLAAICDEIAFWRSEGANPAEEILTAIRPALATIPGSLLLGISTPYSKTGPLYEAFRDKYGQEDPDTLIFKAPTRAMNPTIQDKVIEKALKDDYAAAKAEWLAEFREDLETFLSTEVIEAAMIPGRYELPRIEGVNYCGFVDPSGGRSDSFTLGIAHREKDGNRIILDRLEERKPPFAPQSVAKEYAEIFKRYGIYKIQGDRYAGEWVSQAFRDEGITFEPSKLDKSGLYLEFEPLIAQGQVDLLDDKRLLAQLRGLERRTRSGGKDRVDHYLRGMDDLSNSAAGACVMAAEGKARELEIFVIDPHGDGDSVWDWEQRLIAENKAREQGPPPPPDLEVEALTNEPFTIKFLATMQKYQLISEAAKALKVSDPVLRRWFTIKKRYVDNIFNTRQAEIQKALEALEKEK